MPVQGLNINRGAEVKLRLREFDSTDKFLPYEAIVGTMLHELCHNDIGPHNAQFYKLLDEINLVRRLTSLCGGASMLQTLFCSYLFFSPV